LLLRGLTPICDSHLRAPTLQADFPDATSVGVDASTGRSLSKTHWRLFELSTTPNLGNDNDVNNAGDANEVDGNASSSPSNFNALYRPACMPFSSKAIEAAAAAAAAADNGNGDGDVDVVSYCGGVIADGTRVLVPARSSLHSLNAELASVYHNVIAALPASQCTFAYAQLRCAEVFRSCHDTGSIVVDKGRGIEVPLYGALPRAPCRSACDRVDALCGELFAAAPHLRPLCASKSNVPYHRLKCDGSDVDDDATADGFLPPLDNASYPADVTRFGRIQTKNVGYVAGLGNVNAVVASLDAPCDDLTSGPLSWPLNNDDDDDDADVVIGGGGDGTDEDDACSVARVTQLLRACDCTLATCQSVVCGLDASGGVPTTTTSADGFGFNFVANACTAVKVQLFKCDRVVTDARIRDTMRTLKAFQAGCPQGADVGLTDKSALCE
jgi:hypothetical protein